MEEVRWRGGEKNCVLSQNRNVSCMPAVWTQWISCHESFFPDLYGLPPLVFTDTINIMGIIFSRVSTSESFLKTPAGLNVPFPDRNQTFQVIQIQIFTRGKRIVSMQQTQATGYYNLFTLWPAETDPGVHNQMLHWSRLSLSWSGYLGCAALHELFFLFFFLCLY